MPPENAIPYETPSPAAPPRWKRIAGMLNGKIGLLILLATLLVLGGTNARYRMSLMANNPCIGWWDSGAYYRQALSLYRGHGFKVNYVAHHFEAYAPKIWHRDDHWPPFTAFAIVPFFRLFGESIHSARMAMVGIGAIALPLLTGLLAFSFSRRTWAGLAAGLLMLINLPLTTESLEVMGDVPLAMLWVGFCWALLATRDRPWMHVVAGLFAAAAYYAKGSQIILLGFYPQAAVLLCGFSILRRKHLWIGLGIAFFGMMPWWIANFLEFRHRPLYSSQNYMAAFMGLDPVHGDLWCRNWYGKERPRLSDRWTKYGDVLGVASRRNAEMLTRWMLLGADADEKRWEEIGPAGVVIHNLIAPPTSASVIRYTGQPPTFSPHPAVQPLQQWREPWAALSGVMGTGFILVFLIGTPAILAIGAVKGQSAEAANPPEAGAPQVHASAAAPSKEHRPKFELTRAAWVLIGFLAMQWCFLVFLWSPYGYRFALPFLPFMAAFAATALSRLLDLPEMLLRRSAALRGTIGHAFEWVLTLTLAAGAFYVADRRSNDLLAWHHEYIARHRTFPYGDLQDWYRPGEWLRDHAPHAIVMGGAPMLMMCSAADTNMAVMGPSIESAEDYFGAAVVVLVPDIQKWMLAESAEEYFGIARYYRVTHLLGGGPREYISGQRPGLTPIPGCPYGLWEIDYSKVPGQEYLKRVQAEGFNPG